MKKRKTTKKAKKIVRVEGDVSKKFADAMLREIGKHVRKATKS